MVTLAPLLGLFGTIIGMFHAFSVLAQPGHAPADVTAGVADALVATAFGIFIAMLGLTGYNALTNQVRLIMHQLDSMKMMIINRTDAPAPAASGDGRCAARRWRTSEPMKMRYFEHKKARIEIIPMIDVMLFLLVFFIIVTLQMIPDTGREPAIAGLQPDRQHCRIRNSP